jgi:hypothetical protein
MPQISNLRLETPNKQGIEEVLNKVVQALEEQYGTSIQEMQADEVERILDALADEYLQTLGVEFDMKDAGISRSLHRLRRTI